MHSRKLVEILYLVHPINCNSKCQTKSYASKITKFFSNLKDKTILLHSVFECYSENVAIMSISNFLRSFRY